MSLYFDVVRLSLPDQHGLPQLLQLEFVLSLRKFRMTASEFEDLLDRVHLIHDMNLAHLLEKMKRNG